MRIGKKLILSYSIIAMITFLITAVVLRSSISFFYTESLNNQLVAKANSFKVAIDELGESNLNSDSTRALLSKLARVTDTRITLVNAHGEVLADTQVKNPRLMPSHADRPEIKEALSGKIGKSERFSSTLKQRLLYVAIPYKSHGKVQGALRVALPMSQIENDLNRFSLIILAIALGVIILVVITSYILSRSFTVPLNRMMAMAERMANDDLEQRLPVQGHDEISELSKSLNNLAEKLKRRIDELRSEKAKVDLILDNMAEGILLLNKHGDVVLTNHSIERIFKVKAADVIGKPVIHSIRSFDLDNAITDSMEHEREVVDELSLQDPFRQLRIRIYPIKNTDNEKQTLVVVRDITRQKQTERLRKDFLANVSHELKTPLTGLKLLSDTLLRSIDTDPVSSKIFIKRLDKELSAMINLVRELIDLSKIESPQDTIEKSPIDLGELVNDVASSFIQLAANKELSLNISIPENLPTIVGDKEQLSTLVRNLVDNAIRYTPSGGRIDVKLERDFEHINLIVADNGIGMAKREIPRIFERFYRIDKARSRETGGTGLGLSIAKHIAENHNATIHVDSALGVGSTFTVRFKIDT
ncbi:MAG: cell wall metabolism sensor histidine kinase WalK [Firmicutes bacterium]|nr:cell wall metabolism sensor histidine kinase WalK [Bacillota bacterium]